MLFILKAVINSNVDENIIELTKEYKDLYNNFLNNDWAEIIISKMDPNLKRKRSLKEDSDYLEK